MNNIVRRSLTDQVTEAILTLIQERGLVEGDVIPAVGELAANFDVSVPVVRESVAGLAALGLLKRQQGRESVISTPDADHLGRLFSYRISTAMVSDNSIQDYREIVEVGSAQQAAGNASPAAIAELRSALTVLKAAHDESELHDADVAFHAAVARAGGNDLLILTLEALAPLLRRLRTRVWAGWVSGGGDLQSIIEAHELVLEAIEKHDVAGAGRAMAAHMVQARAGLEREPISPLSAV